jgi:hypothetical protein
MMAAAGSTEESPMPEIWTSQDFKKHSSAGLFARRRNPNIRSIDHWLDRYHAIEPLAFSERRLALLAVVEASRKYLAEKGAKGSKRRQGVVAVQLMATEKAEELTRAIKRRARGNWLRAAAATKPVRVKEGSGAKALDEKYWKELRAPHYAGFALDKIFDEWKGAKTSKNLDDWIESEWLPRARASKDYQTQLDVLKLQSHRVRYLGSPAERQAHRVHVRRGRVYTATGERFHTGDHQTAFSGQGWAIFVMSPARHVYSGSHTVGKFHHSSFLAGGPVLSAGEWAVREGRVVAVTAKSGHYKPTVEMFYQMLRKLKRRGVDLRGVAACPRPFENPPRWFDAQDVYNGKGQPAGRRMPAPRGVSPRAAAAAVV